MSRSAPISTPDQDERVQPREEPLPLLVTYTLDDGDGAPARVRVVQTGFPLSVPPARSPRNCVRLRVQTRTRPVYLCRPSARPLAVAR